jgi:hypothetical protein
MTTEREPDEKLWQLDITACDDGDILLSQGPCWSCHEDAPIRLHRSHLPLLAETAGWLTHNEFQRGIESMRARLSLLAAMVRAHCPEGHPLRAAADELVGRPTTPRAVAAFTNEADSLASAPAASDEQPGLF